MEVEYTGRQTTVTKKLKQQAEEGLARIAKIIGNSANVHLILSKDKYRYCAELTVQTRHQKLVASCEATDMESALHDTLDKLEQQAIRHKKRFGTIKRHPRNTPEKEAEQPEVSIKPTNSKAATKTTTKTSTGRKAVPMLVHSFPSQSPLREPHIVRSTEGVALRPMSIEEAVKEAAFRDRDVFVFRDHEGLAMVLCRKRDGKMELIEVP
jgi:putative sigma-54 modulation protein